LSSLADLARDDEAFLNMFAEARLNIIFEQAHLRDGADLNADCARISVGDLIDSARTASALSRRMVRLLVKRVKLGTGQLSGEHVRAVLELAAHGENGKLLLLPGGVEVRREHGKLIFCARDSIGVANRCKALEFERAINLGGKGIDVRVAELGCVFRFRVIDWPATRGDTIGKEFVLDRDALQSPLVLRNWRPGDKLRPRGHRSAHKLKRLLNQKRVSRWERDGWPVLTSGGVLAWVRGFPAAAEFAAGEKTRSGVVITEEAIS
jgi:tRNA(Ile)-lysidine synthase